MCRVHVTVVTMEKQQRRLVLYYTCRCEQRETRFRLVHICLDFNCIWFSSKHFSKSLVMADLSIHLHVAV